MRRGVCITVGILVILIGSLVGGGSCEWSERDAPCNGSIAECHEESEFFMDSDISRRILQGYKGIVNDALKGNLPANGGKPRGRPYTRPCTQGNYCNRPGR